METVSATELVRKLGDYLARVRYRRESFEIERNGRTVARIVPATDVAPANLGDALSAWMGAGPPDTSFADDLARVNESDRPPKNPWAS